MQNALEGDTGFIPETWNWKPGDGAFGLEINSDAVRAKSFGRRPPYRPAPWVVDFAIAVREMTRELPPEKRRSVNLSFDRMLHGATYVDSNGQRLDPVEVVKIIGRDGAVRWTYRGEPCRVGHEEHWTNSRKDLICQKHDPNAVPRPTATSRSRPLST